jgi:DNA-binding response OmpR family regulator
VAASAARRCVLVADDDPLVRSLWTDALRDAGYRVVEAADGLEAVNAMRFLLPDLVVLDLRMPHLSGQDVLALARGSAAVARIPVLIVSGELASQSPHPEMGLKVVGRLEKPVGVGELIERVNAALKATSPRLPDPPAPPRLA